MHGLATLYGLYASNARPVFAFRGNGAAPHSLVFRLVPFGRDFVPVEPAGRRVWGRGSPPRSEPVAFQAGVFKQVGEVALHASYFYFQHAEPFLKRFGVRGIGKA